jgi:glycosyltransferase involved in cell wall biosynthesis
LAPPSSQQIAGKIPVLFLHTATEPPLGADTLVHTLIMRGLDRTHFDVHVACAKGPPSARTPTFEAISAITNMTVRPVNLGPELFGRSRLGKAAATVRTLPALWSLAGLVHYIRKHHIRIVHTSDRPRDAAAAVLLARLTGTKCIIHVHVEYGDWMSKMLRGAMARADALIGVSSFVVRSLVDHGYPAHRTHVVLNAVDPSAWDNRLDAQRARADLGIPASARVVTTVARVFRPKGQMELIRAVALVYREFPDIRLLIVGQDYPAGTSFSTELKALATELGIARNVEFLGQRRDIAPLLAASDVFALPSVAEPFGLAHAEAMAMKRPVVALRSGGTPEVVEHEKSGLLSEPGDIETLASHISRLLRDPTLSARMGEYGRRQIESRFTLDRMSGDVERVYRSLLASST